MAIAARGSLGEEWRFPNREKRLAHRTYRMKKTFFSKADFNEAFAILINDPETLKQDSAIQF